jgi:precorrin-3B synthase
MAELSDRFADGSIEITSRANLQLRAIRQESLPHVVQRLANAGFLPSPEHDRVRNITASPFAGLDAEEALDTRPFVQELDRRLQADAALASLPAKFNFAIDGGGRWFSRDIDDLSLRAITVDGVCKFHLGIGGIWSGFGVGQDQAVDCVLEAAKICLRVSNEFDLPARGRRIASVPEAMKSLIDKLSPLLVICPRPDDSKLVMDMPVGVYAAKREDLISIIPLVPLGRLTVEQARCIAAIADEWDSDLRLAPWRGVVLGSIARSATGDVAAQLERVGLSYDGKDGYRGISTCAGVSGCDASLANVRKDAELLARRLSGYDFKPGWTVNIAGCDKKCAMRNGAAAEMVATAAGYNLKINGHITASSCSSESAITAVVAYWEGITTEVCS